MLGFSSLAWLNIYYITSPKTADLLGDGDGDGPDGTFVCECSYSHARLGSRCLPPTHTNPLHYPSFSLSFIKLEEEERPSQRGLWVRVGFGSWATICQEPIYQQKCGDTDVVGDAYVIHSIVENSLHACITTWRDGDSTIHYTGLASGLPQSFSSFSSKLLLCT